MTTYTKFKEYIWLVNTIYHAKAITFTDINERWLKTDMSGGVEMARTTFYRHKCAIEDIFGIYIDCDKKNGNRYYIGNEHVLREDSVQNWMLSTLSVGNMVEESQSLHNRILLEHVPSGGEKLQQIIKAMKENRMISLTYRRYGSPDNGTYTLAPYCVNSLKSTLTIGIGMLLLETVVIAICSTIIQLVPLRSMRNTKNASLWQNFRIQTCGRRLLRNGQNSSNQKFYHNNYQPQIIMALWRIVVKNSGNAACKDKRQRLEKGMFIATSTISPIPPIGVARERPMLAQLFLNKYGIDVNVHNMNSGYFNCEKIG